MPFNADRWINSREACDYLGCSERTLRRVIATSRLVAHHLGRHLKFRRADLDKLLEPVNAGMAVDGSFDDFIKHQQGGAP